MSPAPPPVLERDPSVRPPERTDAQRLAALDRANEIRSLRAQLKRDLAGGRKSLAQLVNDPPDYLETAKLFDMLLHLPKWGRVKSNKILSRTRISPSKTFGGLTDRQRADLTAALRDAAAATPRVQYPAARSAA